MASGKLNRWASNRVGLYRQRFTPLIARPDSSLAKEAQEKAALLTASSPVPPKTSLSDTYNYNYSPLIEQYNITERELESVFKRAKAGKAPGPDGIPNQDLHLAKAKLIPLLRPIFNACMQRGIHPQEWDN